MRIVRWTLGLALVLGLPLTLSLVNPAIGEPLKAPSARPASPAAAADPSPVDLVLTPDERHLVCANQGTDSLALVEVASGKTLSVARCGHRPSALAISADGRRVLVACTYSGELAMFSIEDNQLRPMGSVMLGFHPVGVAISPDGERAYVALSAANVVAVVDLAAQKVISKIEVGRWPRYLAVTPDGSRLAVSCSGDGGVSVVDTAAGKLLYQEEFRGINIGQVDISADGKYAYVPWMVYRQNPITAQNIRLGWVLASRICRVKLDGPADREAISLDPRGEAISDPHGMAVTPDGQWMVSAASGTHELLVYRLPDCPFQGYGGPGDHLDVKLANDRNRFYRIPLGGRPMMIRASRDKRHIYVTNYLSNSIQIVDLQDRRVERTISLGGSAAPSLVRQGEAIFFDGARSLDQWYSCHSCHYEGGVNSVTMDTLNDGTIRTFKTVLSLHNVTRTPPWTWHGWQKDLHAAMKKSMKDTMLGPEPTEADVRALTAYLESMETPPNPHRLSDGGLNEAATRGQLVFQSDKAGCSNCHSGPHLTDGQIHDVGLGSPNDVFKGFNTPSIRNVYNRTLYLHHGRAKSLEELLTDLHNPAKVTGLGELSETDRRDLIEFVKSL